MKKINIAIDGPAGSGKSTIAREIAKKLNIIYVDTGAMYRAIAYYFLEKNIDLDDTDELLRHLDFITICLTYKEDVQHILLNGQDITFEIRNQQVAAAASKIATLKEVREKLVSLQKEIAINNSVIMDGRDIGTCVLPNADLKIFLTASVEKRTERRCKELEERNVSHSIDQIKKEIEERDHNDCTRKESPLLQAKDALLIDTSSMEIKEVVHEIISLL